MGGVEVSRATKEFKQDGETYAAGTYVIPFDQVFGALRERHAREADLSRSAPRAQCACGSAIRCLRLVAWDAIRREDCFREDGTACRSGARTGQRDAEVRSGRRKQGDPWSFAYNGAESALVVNRLLKAGAKVTIGKPHGRRAAIVHVTAKADVWNHAVAGIRGQREAGRCATRAHSK